MKVLPTREKSRQKFTTIEEINQEHIKTNDKYKF